MIFEQMFHRAGKVLAISALAAIAGTLIAAAAPAAAQTYPNKPIHMIVPWPPGGGTDISARRIADALSKVLGQPIVVENRGGANGIVGSGIFAKAQPDGYTIMVTQLSSHAMNPTLYKSLPYDTLKDFKPVSMMQSVPLVIVVPAASPIKTVDDIVRMAKAKPGALSYASFGTGSPAHLAGEYMKVMAKIDMKHIPYKGGGPALIDTISGQVDLYFSGVNSALPHIKSGRLRPIAVTSLKRSKAMPDVPTVAESKEFKSYESVVPTGVWLPAGTPDAIAAKLYDACVKVSRSPEFQDALLAEGSEPIGNTPEEMAIMTKREIEKLAELIPLIGIKPE